MNNIKILFVVCLMLLASSFRVLADDNYNINQDNTQQDIESQRLEEEQLLMNIVNADNDQVWPIPEYDKTGMSDSEILLKNYYYYYISQQGKPEQYLSIAKWAIEHINEDGSFPGIDYYDYDYAAGNSMGPNFGNIRAMYMAYITPNQEYYMDERIPELIEKNYRFYHDTVTRKYVKGVYIVTWWNYTIGIPLNLMPALILTNDIVSKDITRAMAMDFLYMPDQMGSGLVTGQNAVWYAQQSVVRGALLDMDDCIKTGIDMISRECRMVSITDPVSRQLMYDGAGDLDVGTCEGMQPDGSYHMHGPQFYATYGYNTIQDFTIAAMVTQGTKYEPEDKYEIVYNNLINGWLWGGRGTEEDVSLLGRTITDKRTELPSTAVIKLAMQRFMHLMPEHKTELETAVRYLLKEDDPQRLFFEGTRFFWRSDYLAHHRRDYSVYLHVNSGRTTAMEFNNMQAESAAWVGFGTTYLTKDNGDSNTPAILYWDWTLLPGITAEKRLPEFDKAGFFNRQKDNFAGGVSDDDYGAAAMRMSKVLGTSAYKSWFFFDDEYVMLGAGISSTGGENINSAIEQRFLIGDVEVNGEVISKGERELHEVKTVLHNNIGYVFPKAETAAIKNKEATGNYSNISHMAGADRKDYKADMFALYIPHGRRPANGEYEVIVIPETDSMELEEYSENTPVRIVSNSKTLQAVYHEKLNIGYAVFYKSGTAELNDNLSVKSDSACILMTRYTDDGLKISVSNPYNYKTDVNLTVTSGGKKYELKYELPKFDENGYDLGGKSMERVIK
ncbi:MAG: hypothetical protein J6N52_13250 [Clostridia bacterium]|nr:hypothetical protein [Clostridia bacterium]